MGEMKSVKVRRAMLPKLPILTMSPALLSGRASCSQDSLDRVVRPVEFGLGHDVDVEVTLRGESAQ